MPKLAGGTKAAPPKSADPADSTLDLADPPAEGEPAKAEAVKKAAKKVAPKKAAPIPFATIGDEEEEYVNILYCGRHGTGKTTALATMANLGPTVYINAEAGMKSKPLRRMGINLENIQIWPNRERGETITWEGIEALFWRMRGELIDRPGCYAGVVWDSLSEIHKLLLEDVVKSAVEKAERNGKDRERFFTDIADYGTMTEQVRYLLRRYRDLPCHFGMTALLRRDIDKKGDGGVVYRPAVTPALIGDLGLFTDMICYTSVGDVDGDAEYRGQFRPEPMYEAKDRFGVIPTKKLVDPTFERVAAYVHGSLEIDNDPVMQEAKARRAKARGDEVAAELAAAGAE